MLKYKLLILIVLISLNLFGEDKSEKGNIILPILISNPEVGFAGGAYIMHYDMKGREKTPDTLQAGIAYTTKNQKQIFCSTQNLFGDIKLNTDSEVKSWASRYYPRSSDSWEYEKYTDNNANLKIMGQKVFKNGWSAGALTRVMYSHSTKKDKGGILENSKPFGIKSIFLSGVGLNVEYDSRNRSFYPTKGEYLSAEYTLFSKAFGSDGDFRYAVVDARKYWSILKDNCIGVQYYFKSADGNVPIQYMPSMGGKRVMRGMYEGRMNDKVYSVLQGEYRFTIYKWLGATIFTGVGEIAESVDKLNVDDINMSYGAGVRFNLGKEDKMNIRIDFALNDLNGKKEETSGLYVDLLEAF